MTVNTRLFQTTIERLPALYQVGHHLAIAASREYYHGYRCISSNCKELSTGIERNLVDIEVDSWGMKGLRDLVPTLNRTVVETHLVCLSNALAQLKISERRDS